MRLLSSNYKSIGLRILNIGLITSLVVFVSYFMITQLFFLILVIGFSALLQQPIQLVKRRLNVTSFIATLICLFIGLSLFVSLFGGMIVYLIDLFDSIIIQFPVYFQTIIDVLKDTLNTVISSYLPSIEQFLGQFDFDLTAYLTSAIDHFYQWILTTCQKLVNQMIPIISEAIIQTIELTSTTFVVLVLIILLSKDWQTYKQAVGQLIPNQVRNKISDVFRHFIRISWGYLKVELIISGVTTVVLIIGFYLLKIENAFLLGIALGLVDLIPIIGAGLLLWPWILYTLVTEGYSLTIGLATIYFAVVCVRQFLEPKLISKQVGMNAFFVICFGYIFFLFFGIVGILLTPLVLVSIQTIKESQLDQLAFCYIRSGKIELKSDDK